MGTCGACFGSGRQSCSACHGRGYIPRLTASGDMDMSPCAVCGGSRKVRCQFCGGRGEVTSPSDSSPAGPTRPRKRRASEDLLEGRWNGPQGSWFEFTREDGEYRVAEGGPLGTTGRGSATIDGQTVTVQSTNVLLGQYRLELRLAGDQLIGQLNVMGFPMPIIMNRG